jgi:DoxX-like family
VGLLATGYGHSVGYDQSVSRRGMGWLTVVGATRMGTIGGLEVLAAVGLVLPGLTRILPLLTPITATCVVVLMAFAAVFHARRPGESQNVVTNLGLAVLAALVAYGRFVVAPF